MPRHFFFLDDPYLAARALAPHLTAWVVSIGSIHLKTPSRKSCFTVKVLDQKTQLLEVLRNTGSKRRVLRCEWRRSLEEYVANDGNTDLRLYQGSGSLFSYLLPLFSRLTTHAFNEECFCFPLMPALERESAVMKDPITDLWDIRD